MRIIIVEDEVKIREGMAKLIESHTNHVVLYKAADGEDGLNSILRFKPDLAIVDIQMPKMNGLDMIQELQKRKFPVHTIILSGYSEFEYAKRAIRYGVDDYLLKPLTVEDVTNVLQKIEECIKEEQLTKGTAELHIMNLMYSNESEEKKIYEILQQICNLPEEGRYELFAGYIGSAEEGYHRKLEETIKELKDKYKDITMYYIYVENIQNAYILACSRNQKENFEDLSSSLYRRMIFSYQNKKEQAVWTKQSFVHLKNLKQMIQKSDFRLRNALCLSYSNYITDEMIRQKGRERLDLPSAMLTRLKNAIYVSDASQIKAVSDDVISYVERGDYSSEDIKRAFLKVCYIILDTLQDINIKVYEYLLKNNHQKKIENAVTWEELVRAYGDIIGEITDASVNREDISNYIIKKAIAYIREHYQEGITQEELSRKLEITPEYLSTLFKRELGINFSIFLKQFRLSQAKRLLKGTNMKIYEVAEAVGYGDPKYFQRVFKEEYGISPGEYRTM